MTKLVGLALGLKWQYWHSVCASVRPSRGKPSSSNSSSSPATCSLLFSSEEPEDEDSSKSRLRAVDSISFS